MSTNSKGLDYPRIIIFLGVLILLWAGISVVVYYGYVTDLPHMDFFIPWVGAREALFKGGDLYSQETTNTIQITIYKQLLPESIDQQRFAYPAHIVILLLPFFLIPDMYWAASIWTGFSSVLLIGSAWLLSRSLEQPRPYQSLFLLLYPYGLMNLFVAQFTIVPLAAISLAYVAMKKGSYFLTGVLLVTAFIKPELALVPGLYLGIIALKKKRWNVIWGGFISGLVLLGFSIFLLGWWFPAWLSQANAYTEYADIFWPLVSIWDWQPVLGIIGVLVLVWSLWRLCKVRGIDIGVIVILGTLLIPQTKNYSLAILLIPLFMLWKKGAIKASLGIILFSWVFLIISYGGVNWHRGQLLQLWVMPLVVLLAYGLVKNTSPLERGYISFSDY
jgi:hypothetical protein